MKILLVHAQHEIQRFGTGLYRKYLRYAPLTMPTLAALVPEELGAEVEVVDEMVEPLDFDAPADLVGITAITSASPRAYEIARRFRERGATVVLGGVHATLRPEEALEHVDVVVRGYAEETWPQLLRDFQAGSLKRIYGPPQRIARRVAPRRGLIRRSNYVAPNTVEMSRGCPKRCDFCVIHRLDPSFRARDIGEVLSEIRALPGRLVTFLDPNLVGDIPQAYRFFSALAGLKKVWVGCVTLDVLRSPGLLDLLVESGARGFLIGFESLNQEALHSVHKGFHRVDQYASALDLLHRKGVMVQGSFIFGFDGDDPGVFDRTVDFIVRVRVDLPQFTVLTPFPGTPLYQRLDREGRILTRDWSRYNGHEVVFAPRPMTREQLEQGVRHAWNRAYSLPAIARRLWGRPFLLKPLALLSNLNFRSFMRRVHLGG